MADVVALKCPSCGAKLEVFNDMHTFACGHCGNAVIAKRRGGTVSLSLQDAVEAVAANTDRTAAELALQRLEKELAEARMYLERLEESSAPFEAEHLMGEAEIALARRRVATLGSERMADSNSLIPKVGAPLTIVLIIVGGVITFTRHGFANVLGALIVCVVVGVIVFFLIMAPTAFIDSRRDDKQRDSLQVLKTRIERHDAAVEHKDDVSRLANARAWVHRINTEIDRNHSILRS